MKTEYRPIAMRCTQEQFDSIKDRIPLPIEVMESFNKHHPLSNYLINFYSDKRIVNNLVFFGNVETHETFDGELFLDCCGREKKGEYWTEEAITRLKSDCYEKALNLNLKEYLKENKEFADKFIKEYLKDKVFKGSELQYEWFGDWVDCTDFKVRLKPQPDYSKEIEALQNKAKENGQKITIKIE